MNGHFLFLIVFWAMAAVRGAPPAPRDSLIQKQKDLMAAGHLSAAIAGEAGEEVRAGPLFRIASLEVLGHREPGLQNWGEKFAGRPASRETLAEIRKELSEALLHLGYPFARFQFQIRDEEVSRVSVSIDLETGKGYKLGPLQFSGTRTKPEALMRLSLLKVGEIYRPRRVEQAQRKLARSGYFQSVSRGQLYRDSAKLFLYPSFDLIDIKGNTISGILGYDNSGTQRDEGFTGFLDVHLLNVLGTARQFDFEFSSQDFKRVVRLSYAEPWIFTLPLGAGFDFSLYLEDSVYSETLYGFALFQDLNFYSRYRLTYAIQDNTTLVPADSGALEPVHSSAVVTGIDLTFDGRDAFPHTRSGGLWNLGLRGLRRDVRDSIQYLVQPKNQADWWQPLFHPNWTLHLKAAGAVSWPLKTSLKNRGNLFLLGGANTLRGYLENAFLTNFYVLENVEILYNLSAQNRLLAFVDQGFINRNTGGVYWKRVYGYGLGMELGSKDWQFGISYALNPDRNIGEGLLHFKVSNRF